MRMRSETSIAITAAALLAMMLPGCKTTTNDGQRASQSLATRVTDELGGCDRLDKPHVVLAAPWTNAAIALPVNSPSLVKLVPVREVVYTAAPSLRERSPKDLGGLLHFTAPASGTYWLGTKSLAWVDLVDRRKQSVVKARAYQWTTFCGRRMKAGIFELQASTRYTIQISASPDAVVELFIAGPLTP